MQRLIGFIVVVVAAGLGVFSLVVFFSPPSSVPQLVVQPTYTSSREAPSPSVVTEAPPGDDAEGKVQGMVETVKQRLDRGELDGPYRVSKVVDGDTIDVIVSGKATRVRVIGMDTPETRDTRTAVECFGREASERAKVLLEGKNVLLETDESQDDRDKYKRLLRHVFVDGGEGGRTNFALEMIADGYAFEYTYDVPSRYQQEYKAAEREARVAGKGLWSPRTCNGKHQPASQTGSGGVKP